MLMANSTPSAPASSPETIARSEHKLGISWNITPSLVDPLSTETSTNDETTVSNTATFLTTVRKVTPAIFQRGDVISSSADATSSPDVTSPRNMTSWLNNMTSSVNYAPTVEEIARLTTSPLSETSTSHPGGPFFASGSSSLASTVGSHNDGSLKDGHYTSYVVCASVLILLVVTVVSVVLFVRWRQYFGYRRLSPSGPGGYDYIYKPLQGHGLDEEYENTFVGVSVPLLQEVSKI